MLSAKRGIIARSPDRALRAQAARAGLLQRSARAARPAWSAGRQGMPAHTLPTVSLFKAASTVSLLTLASRITGLVRDLLMASMFGANALTDAFNVAFRIPNLFRRLFAEGAFSQAFVPVLAGVSRKSMIGQITGRDVDGRVAGSAADALLAAQNGAGIIRVHDVAETRDVLAVLAAVQGAKRKDHSVKAKPAIQWPDD